MKKEFFVPSMTIVTFDVENIVTGSSAEPKVTNQEVVTNAITSRVTNGSTIANISLTW